MIRVAAIAALLCAAAPFSSNGAMVGSPFGQAPFGQPSSGGTGKTFLATFSKTGSVWTPAQDPGITSSITFLLDGGALDAKGAIVSVVGSAPPVSTATPFYPAGFGAAASVGAGQLDDTHNFSIPSPGPFDLPGPGFWTCAGYTLDSVPCCHGLAGHHNGDADGWFLNLDGAARPSLWLANATTLTQVVDNASLPQANGLSLVCSGVTADGLYGYIESDYDVPVGATPVTSDPTKVTLLASYLPATVAGRIGTALPGAGFGGYILHGRLVWVATSTTPATGALLRSIHRQFFGMVSDTGQYFRVYRNSKDSLPINGTRFTTPAYVLRINENGAKTNVASTNYFFPALNPPTQTSPDLPVGSYTVWIEGTGSAVITAAGATATGLPCTATAGQANDCHFAVTAHGTILATMTGAVTAGQLEPQVARTDLILSTNAAKNRAAETVWVPSLDIIDGAIADNGLATVTPDYLSTAASSDLTLWSNPVGATVQRLVHLGATNKWELQIGGQTVDSAVAPLTAGAAVQIGWSWKTGAPVALTVNNVATKSAGNAAAFTPGPVLYTDSSATDGSNASLNRIQWNGRTRYPSFTAATACIGDSLMADNTNPPATGISSCYTLGTLRGPKFATTNFAIYGATITQIAAQYTNSVQGQNFKVLVVEGAINNIGGGATAAFVEGQIQPALDNAMSAGMVVALVAVTPWNGTGNPSAIFPWTGAKQTQTDLYNAWLAAYAAAHPTKAVYVDTYTAFGRSDDGTFQSPLLDDGDATHHTQLAYDYQAQLIRDALVTLPAGSFQ